MNNNELPKKVREWLSIANDDLLAAKALFDINPETYKRIVPFHCQQAVEKSIKAYLTYRKIKFDKIHDISKLSIPVLADHPEFEVDLKEADFLTDYAVEFRYPESTSISNFSTSQTLRAIHVAVKVNTIFIDLIRSYNKSI